MTIGIIGALEQEVNGLLELMTNKTACTKAGLCFTTGQLEGKDAVIARCRIGKVNAAACTQLLIDSFPVTSVLNTGLAGAIDPSVGLGHMVVSSAALYHDFDVTALGFKPGEIPETDMSCFPADPQLQRTAVRAAQEVVGKEKTHLGLVVSGDQFISSVDAKTRILNQFGALCTEMEGAAIAHVASLNAVPYLIIRTITDLADNSAAHSFEQIADQLIPQLNQVVRSLVTAYPLPETPPRKNQ